MNSGAGDHRATRRSTLAWRARPTRTFGSLLGFAALLSLSVGVYLITEALVHPLAAHEVGLIAGAVIIALASILFFYLVKPDVSHGRAPSETRTEASPALDDGGSANARLSPAGKNREAGYARGMAGK